MNYIDEIFLRADIQQIREFLLYGVGELNVDPRTYKERLESAKKRMTARLHEEYTDMEEYEEITGLIYTYTSTVETVYMEIGIRTGAILMFDLLRENPDGRCISKKTNWEKGMI